LGKDTNKRAQNKEFVLFFVCVGNEGGTSDPWRRHIPTYSQRGNPSFPAWESIIPSVGIHHSLRGN